MKFSLGSPIAVLIIASYMNYGQSAAASYDVMLTNEATLKFFVLLFASKI